MPGRTGGELRIETPPTQLSFLAPDEAAMLSTLRESLRALSHLHRGYEVGRLTEPEHELVVRTPEDLAGLLLPEMESLAQEQLRAVLLNTRYRVLRIVLVYQGSIAEIAVRPADVYRDAVATGAAAIVLAHNHPSGDCSPSPADIASTRMLGDVGALLGVELVDHLIIGRGEWVSLARERLYVQPEAAWR